jgi:phenylacetate-coenzyme A ligase PaaK-like adenylate-forming protein
MELNVDLLQEFLEVHKGETVLLFGFTFMIYKHFYKELLRKGLHLDLSNAMMIHGGGWKKMISEAVSIESFKKKLNGVCGISHVHDYYGMVEQTGSIYMECECGNLHVPIFSDVIIRRVIDFSLADYKEKGIVQVVSVLPKSYPGHSLLTEDEGILLGEDDCSCGRLGKYFKITGRLKNAEIRGCSDTYASEF